MSDDAIKTVELPMMRLEELELSELFSKLFSRSEQLIDTIADDMRSAGFDPGQPLVAWHIPERKAFVLIDGYTRYEAAKRSGLEEVPVNLLQFESEQEALDYAIHVQRDQRNLTDAELAGCVDAVDGLKKSGRPEKGRKLASLEANLSGKSATETAEKVGTSRAKVEKWRSIKKHGGPDTQEAVKTGKKTINQAYRETRQQRKKGKAPREDPSVSKLIKTLKECEKELESADWEKISRTQIKQFLEASQPISRCRIRLQKKS